MEFRIPREDGQKSGVYKITNVVNGKFYIGSAARLRKRFSSHKCDLGNRSHDNEYLIHAYHKHGANNFTFECIEFVEKGRLIEREQFFIDDLKACDPEIGYNICPTAGSTLGLKRTQESKDNISRKHGRKVYQWEFETGYLFAEHDSIGMAEKATGFSRDGIKCAALGYNKHKHAGFVWSYESIPSKTKGQNRGKVDISIVNRTSETKGTKVVQKDISGNLIKEHKNARFAQMETGFLAHGIRVSCRKGSVYCGYKWEYVGDVKNGGKVGKNATRFGVKFTTEHLIDMSRKSGPVIQYDLNGNIVKEHLSLIEAHLYSGIDKKVISTCCFYNKHHINGFVFRFKELLGRKFKTIHRLDENLNPVESFDSIYQACDKHHILTSSIYQSIRKGRKCDGFYWEIE